jgi:iron complex transport system substrate-binding protein
LIVSLRFPLASLAVLLLVTLAAPAHAAPARIVSLGGALTEIVCALGYGSDLVGIDAGSTHPASVQKLPRTGHAREIAVEGVLSLRPTLVLATDEAGPPGAVTRLKESGVPLVVVPSAHGVAEAAARIRTIGAALGAKERGDSLARALEKDVKSIARAKGAPRVLFVYARGAGTVNVAGDDTAADAIVELAGGVNAVTGFTGYRPLTAEGVLAAKPDVIVTPASSAESLGGVAALLALPGVGATPAGKAKRVVTFDTLYLLGFGPRTALAANELARAIEGGRGR